MAKKTKAKDLKPHSMYAHHAIKVKHGNTSGMFAIVSEGVLAATREYQTGARSLDWSTAPDEQRMLYEKFNTAPHPAH